MVDLFDCQECHFDVAGLDGDVARQSQQHVASGHVVSDFSSLGEEFPGKLSLLGGSLGGGEFIAVDLFGEFGRGGLRASLGNRVFP